MTDRPHRCTVLRTCNYNPVIERVTLQCTSCGILRQKTTADRADAVVTESFFRNLATAHEMHAR